MKNKAKYFITFWVAFLGVNLIFLVENTRGSGTYCPPPSYRVYEFSKEDIAQGEKLFEGGQLIGPGGKTCQSCHGDGQSVQLKRSSLKEKADQLDRLINRCLTDPARSAGQSLELRSPHMKQLGVYLICRYRLPYDTFKCLNYREKSGMQKLDNTVSVIFNSSSFCLVSVSATS